MYLFQLEKLKIDQGKVFQEFKCEMEKGILMILARNLRLTPNNFIKYVYSKGIWHDGPSNTWERICKEKVEFKQDESELDEPNKNPADGLWGLPWRLLGLVQNEGSSRATQAERSANASLTYSNAPRTDVTGGSDAEPSEYDPGITSDSDAEPDIEDSVTFATDQWS